MADSNSFSAEPLFESSRQGVAPHIIYKPPGVVSVSRNDYPASAAPPQSSSMMITSPAHVPTSHPAPPRSWPSSMTTTTYSLTSDPACQGPRLSVLSNRASLDTSPHIMSSAAPNPGGKEPWASGSDRNARPRATPAPAKLPPAAWTSPESASEEEQPLNLTRPTQLMVAAKEDEVYCPSSDDSSGGCYKGPKKKLMLMTRMMMHEDTSAAAPEPSNRANLTEAASNSREDDRAVGAM